MIGTTLVKRINFNEIMRRGDFRDVRGFGDTKRIRDLLVPTLTNRRDRIERLGMIWLLAGLALARAGGVI